MSQVNGAKGDILWPKTLQGSATQRVIEEFFAAADDATKEGSTTFSKCFTSTGELMARGHVCKGQEEIFKFREGAWDPINFRKHEVRKVYVSDHDNKDITMLGHVTFGHKNGQQTSTDYVGNFAFADTEQGPRIEKYQAWLDSKPLADLMATTGKA